MFMTQILMILITVFKKTLNTIPSLDTHHLILAGDFNHVMAPDWDRSSSSSSYAGPRSPKSVQILQAFIDTHTLIDPWRFKNPN